MRRSTIFGTMSFISIRPLTLADTDVLSRLCRQIYPQFFTYLWYDDGQWYQEHTYHTAQLSREIAEENTLFFFIEKDQLPVGYLKVKLHYDNQPDSMEVERIYCLKEHTGQGLGKRLLQQAWAIADAHQKTKIFLKVMDSSHDSIAFYEKMGFVKIGTYQLDYQGMKPQYRGMFVMCWEKKNS
jgi:diamine N-acetyltransferase